MQKTITLLIFLLVTGSMGIQAQSLIIKTKDGVL